VFVDSPSAGIGSRTHGPMDAAESHLDGGDDR
jgi:hypothetical protein